MHKLVEVSVMFMFSKMKRSIEITKLSFAVLFKDLEMMLYPIFSAIFSFIFLITMVYPTIMTYLIGGNETLLPIHYVIVFTSYLGVVFIATFFNVCTVYTVKKRFTGGNATFFESLGYALSKVHLILMWSLVSATVGVLLKMISDYAERLGTIGQMIVKAIASVLGMGWSIIAIFVIPGMVYHDLSPFDAIKKSVDTIKKTWGESIIISSGVGLIQFLLLIAGIVASIIITYIGLVVFSNPVIILYSAISAVVYIVLLFLVFGVLAQVYNTALYVYADTGAVPVGFTEATMADAFTSKKR